MKISRLLPVLAAIEEVVGGARREISKGYSAEIQSNPTRGPVDNVRERLRMKLPKLVDPDRAPNADNHRTRTFKAIGRGIGIVANYTAREAAKANQVQLVNDAGCIGSPDQLKAFANGLMGLPADLRETPLLALILNSVTIVDPGTQARAVDAFKLGIQETAGKSTDLTTQWPGLDSGSLHSLVPKAWILATSELREHCIGVAADRGLTRESLETGLIAAMDAQALNIPHWMDPAAYAKTLNVMTTAGQSALREKLGLEPAADAEPEREPKPEHGPSAPAG